MLNESHSRNFFILIKRVVIDDTAQVRILIRGTVVTG